MPTHNSVPTTCTASQLTNWSIPDLNSSDQKRKIRARLNTVRDLRNAGFKRDFALIFAITTATQIKTNGLDDFLPKIGFEKSFHGVKSDDSKTQRHQETGDLTMWCTTPKVYEESLNNYFNELTEELNRIDPPKKPDPNRQKFPPLRGLVTNGIVQKNSQLQNPIKQVLLVDREVAYRHIKMKFGIDLKTWKNKGENWVDYSLDEIRREQENWKNELI